jgi:hypothetical protein
MVTAHLRLHIGHMCLEVRPVVVALLENLVVVGAAYLSGRLNRVVVTARLEEQDPRGWSLGKASREDGAG